MSIEIKIEQKLLEQFEPAHLEVINESHLHNVAPGSESHFKVVIVSDEFEGKRLLMRHRSVNAVLADELANDIHALALHTYTAHEWHKLYDGPVPSPKCMGGMKTAEAN